MTPRTGPPLADSLKWALLVPPLLAFGGWVAQYPYGLIVVGVIIAVVTAFVAIAVVGSSWQRPGAAVLVAVTGFALPIFAGPALYIVYMETLGESAPAVVTKVENRDARRGADWFCTVVETTGDHTVHKISQQENCFGQIKPLQKITLRKDPLGLLDPRLPDRPGESDTLLSVLLSAALFAANAATFLYAGLRRRGKAPSPAAPDLTSQVKS
ncbi:hypothetical protein [Actinomadura madurae]|uniref:Uncharacterized protein n=1 Tax=Actinomadura madurae TaxID=1993 RepID=A0A1I5MNX6_9ACTN|nr:hypothetical protein [Actinomadura madurae]SFP11007.1 hypothetical protein SAMN04489713_111349 [Actinomadura madurae]SPT60820.1 Uncharacterised protein [Actinomadura madurae]